MQFWAFILILLITTSLNDKEQNEVKNSPVEKIELVADHIIDSNPFHYVLKPTKKKESLTDLNYIDFGRTFGNHSSAVAYGLSWIDSPVEQEIKLQLEYGGGLKIFLNNNEIFNDDANREATIRIEERSLQLSKQVKLNLKAGKNKLLLKSSSNEVRWVVYFKTEQKENLPELGLQGNSMVSEELTNLSNWLVIGPFESNNLQTSFPPEETYEVGRLYDGLNGKITWTIPKIEVLADAKPIDPIWGSYLNFNYHTAGVAWAMMHLSEFTGKERFDEYAKKYTDFMIETKPFVRFQMEELNEYYSVNYHMVDVPLLDFTLAPALPFIYRLIKEDDFENKKAYKNWVDEITEYAINDQVRLNGNHFTRLTPKVYATWVDDMYMGLPYLIHVAKYTDDPKLKKQLFDDAASQILSFNKEVWDEKAQLYQHAQFSEKKVKMPHWSRANGWGIWAVTEVLKELPVNHPQYKTILKHYRNHVESLVRYQEPDGFWRNVLDVKESVKETSGTAIFTMAIARGINEGWLKRRKYEEVALKGWSALDSVIENDGTVRGICMGTMCSEDLDYYLNRPIVDDDSHGMLGLIMAGIEVQKMIDETKQGLKRADSENK
ncbi:MAG: glycoside hydrolase family 88/105 protein [Tangfeifania sp.]